WITGTVTDESTRLPGFSHDHVAAAEAFIQSKKLCRVIRLTGCYRKDGQVTAANRAEQRIAVCWWYFTRLQRARNNNRGYHYQNNSKNRKAGANRQPHSRASPVLRSYFSLYYRHEYRHKCSLVRAILCVRHHPRVRPRCVPGTPKIERAGGLIRE